MTLDQLLHSLRSEYVGSMRHLDLDEDTTSASEICAAFTRVFTDCYFTRNYDVWTMLHSSDFSENVLGRKRPVPEGKQRRFVFQQVCHEIAEFGATELFRRVLEVDWAGPDRITAAYVNILCREEVEISHPLSFGMEIKKIGNVWRLSEIQMPKPVDFEAKAAENLVFFKGWQRR